jgi:hypothetical protein
MKKIVTALILITVLLIEANASTWEGAASVSVGGDLPETGYFVATNSFPRNSIVEITNLENNKTVRAIVTAGLDNPGLLVVLSKEAADNIGLQLRSIGRVVMRQPADSAVFSRFSGSGDPDYDPSAMIASSGFNQSLYDELLAEEFNSGEAAAENSVEDLLAEYYLAFLAFLNQVDEELLAQAAEEGVPPEEDGILAPAEEGTSLAVQEEVLPVQEENIASANEAPNTETPIESGPALAAAPTAPAPATPATNTGNRNELENYDIALVPADNRTPSGAQPAINPGNTVAPIPQAPPSSSQTPAAPAAVIPVQTIVPPPQPAQTVPIQIVQPAAAPVTPAPAAPVTGFSAPMINDLERGKYYIQVAALTRADSVERELARIGNSVPRAIQRSGTLETPVYRILIGPINLGESGALLQRYKAMYNDAFVRLGS